MREAAIYVNAHPTEITPLLIKFAKVKATDVGKVRVLSPPFLSIHASAAKSENSLNLDGDNVEELQSLRLRFVFH